VPSEPWFRRLKRETLRPSVRASALIPLLVCSVGIFILSSIPGNRYPKVEFRFADKWMHFLMYLPLGLTAARYFWWKGKRHWLWPVAFGALYGALDEWHQRFVPLRSCSLADFETDLLAVCTATLIWRVAILTAKGRDFQKGSANQLDPVDCPL